VNGIAGAEKGDGVVMGLASILDIVSGSTSMSQRTKHIKCETGTPSALY